MSMTSAQASAVEQVIKPYLDLPPEKAFDDIAYLASLVCGTQVAVVNLIDEKAQWFKGRVGLDVEGLPRDVGFCPLCLVARDVVVVPDVLADPAYASNPIATNPPFIRFYAGMPLVTAEGLRLGTLGVADPQPRSALTEEQKAAMRALARQAVTLLEQRRALADAQRSDDDRVEDFTRLRSSERYFRGLLEDMDAIIWEVDYSTRRFTMVTPTATRVLGYATSQFTDVSFLIERIHPDDRARVVDQSRQEWKAGRDHHVEFRMLRHDGEVVWLHARAYMVRDAAGAIQRVRGMMVDMTARKRAEAELAVMRREASRSEKFATMGSLVSGVAHEIRTPLTYVQNALSLLQVRLTRLAAQDEQVRELLPMIASGTEGVERIGKIVSHLRRFTTLDAGERTLESLDEIVKEAAAFFSAIHRSGINLELDLEPTPPLPVVRFQIEQIVLNLLSNAADAMPNGGTIRVETRSCPTGGGKIVVEDEGTGIPEEVRSRLFEPLTTTKPHGMGLGLSIVKRIVDEHRGSIEWDSVEGKSTRFAVALPSHPARSEAGRHAAGGQSNHADETG